MIIDINDRYFKSTCPEFILNEFNKATEYETNELCFMYIKQFRLEKLVNKKTFINLYTKEGRNLEFLKFLCEQLEKYTGEPYKAIVFYDDNEGRTTDTVDIYVLKDEKLIKKREEEKKAKAKAKKEEQEKYIRNIGTKLGNYINIVENLYYDEFTENVYSQHSTSSYVHTESGGYDIDSISYVPVYCGNFLMCYSPKYKKFYYRDYNNTPLIITENVQHLEMYTTDDGRKHFT